MKRSRLALMASVAVATAIALTACSTDQSQPGAASPTDTAVAQGDDCQVNAASAPVPTAEPYEPVPAADRISVALSGIPSGTVKPGDPPVEVDVALCNDSPVDYPKVGVVVVLKGCSCATFPNGLPEGTVERFDPATGGWTPVEHPVITTGMDYLGGFDDVQDLPKGTNVTLRYRIALDASMTDGNGGVQAVVVTPDPLVQIGKADMPFTVSKEPTAPTDSPSTAQTVLPFTGLTYPSNVTTDSEGNVYIVDEGRVLELPAGSKEQTVLPFTGLKSIGGVAADSAGDVYVTDFDGSRVMKLAAGSDSPTVLPFTGLASPDHIAVDKAGTVYVTDRLKRVVKLTTGSNEQTVLPLHDTKWADGLALDDAGNVYISDSPNNRVLKLAAGTNGQTEIPVPGIDRPESLAVNAAGDVFVIDGDKKQVVKLAAGEQNPTVLPFSSLVGPAEVAVDGAGNVYVTDNSGFGRVVKLAAS